MTSTLIQATHRDPHSNAESRQPAEPTGVGEVQAVDEGAAQHRHRMRARPAGHPYHQGSAVGTGGLWFSARQAVGAGPPDPDGVPGQGVRQQAEEVGRDHLPALFAESWGCADPFVGQLGSVSLAHRERSALGPRRDCRRGCISGAYRCGPASDGHVVLDGDQSAAVGRA